MKAALVRKIKGMLPAKLWTYLQSVRSRNHQVRWLKSHGVLDLAKRFSDLNGSTVRHGPFAGMKYLPKSILNRHSVPMLLGSYERELHQIIDTALLCQYDLIIDVGSAEGYYAVGFALKGKSPVTAFETETRELKLCKEMARLNNVESKLRTYAWCSPETLRNFTVGKRCFILSDCEGYETELFDEATVETLRMSDLLVETHGDAYEPLHARFSKTHVVQTLLASDRSASDYPELAQLGNDALRAVTEYRSPGQRWLYARSTRRAGADTSIPPATLSKSAGQTG